MRLNNDSNNAMGVSLTASVDNNGTLILDGPSEDQFLGGFTLTNNALLQVTGTGGRLVGNNITNSATGTIDIDQDVNFGFTPTIANSGAIDIAAGKTMFITGSGGGPVYNQSGGTVNVAGTLSDGGAYNHSGGTTTVAAGGVIDTTNHNIAMSGGTLKGAGTVNLSSQTLTNTGGTVHPGELAGDPLDHRQLRPGRRWHAGGRGRGDHPGQRLLPPRGERQREPRRRARRHQHDRAGGR